LFNVPQASTVYGPLVKVSVGAGDAAASGDGPSGALHDGSAVHGVGLGGALHVPVFGAFGRWLVAIYAVSAHGYLSLFD
jgi:hypothetical protein